MTIITIILLSALVLAGMVYSIKTDIQEYKAPAPENKPDPQVSKHIAQQIEFCNSQLEILYRREEIAAKAYYSAAARVESDLTSNKYSACVPQKIVNKHINERDAAEKKLLTAQSQTQNLELKKVKLKNQLIKAAG